MIIQEFSQLHKTGTLVTTRSRGAIVYSISFKVLGGYAPQCNDILLVVTGDSCPGGFVYALGKISGYIAADELMAL